MLRIWGNDVSDHLNHCLVDEDDECDWSRYNTSVNHVSYREAIWAT